MLDKLKDIGIIGGAGPEAGILLVKQIIKICQEKYHCKRDKDFPYIALFSYPFAEMLANEETETVAKQIQSVILKECSSSRFWAIACNTLHCYLGNLKLPNRFVNILEETANAVSEKPIVLCSSTSKKHQIHRAYFDCDYAPDAIQSQLDKLIDELVAKEPDALMAERFHLLIKEFENKQIVLGCTEFSLLHYSFRIQGNIVDPMQIAAEKLCSLYFGEKK